MKSRRLKFISLLLVSLMFGLGLASFSVQAQMTPEQKATFEAIQIKDKLGTQVSIDSLEFTNEFGEKVFLSEYFSDSKPVLINMIYFGCPSICGFLLNGMTEAMKRLDLSIGESYRVLTVSIDPTEGPELALAKKETYLKQYGRDGAEQDWHFLTGTEDQIRQLTEEIGFGYKWVEEINEYAHSAGIFVLTPKGILSRVLYGIEFKESDLKLALLEASGGKIGTLTDRFLMFCFRYDPEAKGYALHAYRVVQVGAGLFALLLIGYLFLFWRRDSKTKRMN